MEKIQGLFKGTVLDTAHYMTTGTIRIKLDAFSGSDDDYRDCIILTPYGGLDLMGLDLCPPIGAQGYVLLSGGSINDAPLWMGGSVVQSDKNLKRNIQEKVPPEQTTPETIVFRTQYTSKNTGGDDLTSVNNKVESIIKINKDELTFSKPRQDFNYSYLSSGYNISNEKINYLSISDTQIILKYTTSSNKKVFVSVTDSGVELNFNGKSKIKLDTSSMEINVNDASIISMDDQGTIAISASSNIQLNGSDDNALYYSVFDKLVQDFNAHTHAPGSDSPSTSYPLPRIGGALGALLGTGTNSALPITGVTKKFPQKQKYTMNMPTFDISPAALFGSLFGLCYTKSKDARTDKNKL